MRKIVFLPSTVADLCWFDEYYTSAFPDGHVRAVAHYKAMLQALKDNPHIGRPMVDQPHVRKLPIPRTPFVLLYRLAPERIEILRLLDARSGQR